MQNATKLKMVGSIGLEPMYLVREMDLQSTVIAAIRTPPKFENGGKGEIRTHSSRRKRFYRPPQLTISVSLPQTILFSFQTTNYYIQIGAESEIRTHVGFLLGICSPMSSTTQTISAF
jgi:hypothetical protein